MRQNKIYMRKAVSLFLVFALLFSSLDVMAMEPVTEESGSEAENQNGAEVKEERVIMIVCGQDYLIDLEKLEIEDGKYEYSIVDEDENKIDNENEFYVSIKKEESEEGEKIFLHGDSVGEGASLQIESSKEINEESGGESTALPDESELSLIAKIPIVVYEEATEDPENGEDSITQEMGLLDESEENPEDASEGDLEKELLPPSNLSLSMAANGIELRWTPSENARGYAVYRKTSADGEWKLLSDKIDGSEVSYRDTSASNGQKYWYIMKAYNKEKESEFGKEAFYLKLDPPVITRWVRNSSTKMTLYWNRNTNATGYQIQYSRSSTFAGPKTITITNPWTASRQITKLEKKKTYYARIRSYYTYSGRTYYSSWNATGNIKNTKKISLTGVKSKKKMVELRKLAGEGVGQFSISQGACTDGTYGYYLLTNNTINKCKILKIRMSNFKKVKVSGILDVNHGNDITYDSHKRLLVVCHNNGGNGKKFSYVDPNTLNVVSSKKVEVPTKIAGGSLEDAKSVKGFGGIAYNASRRQYVAMISNVHHLLIMDENLNPIRMAKTSKNNNYWFQGIDTTDEYVLVCMSPMSAKQKYNIIMVYDWDGNYISSMNVKKGYEIENLFHIGNQYYVTFYHIYYKTYYQKVKKKVTVKGKTKIKKVKVKKKVLQRDNFVYKMSIF